MEGYGKLTKKMDEIDELLEAARKIKAQWEERATPPIETEDKDPRVLTA